jgi:hypothetical protein
VSTGTGKGAQLVLVEQPSNVQTVVNTALTGTNGWTQVSTTLTLGLTTTSLEARVVLSGSGTANFDDLVATAQPTCGLPSISFASGLTLSPASDPSTGTAASGGTTASVQSDRCTFTLLASAPASPGFPAGALQAACDGQPPVALVAGAAVTVCSGRPGTSGSPRSVPITYTLRADWTVAAVTDAVLGIQWQISHV